MRIIAGTHRSRRLEAPQGAETRPTADRVRESLFSILGPPAPDAAVLDLYAGAGTLGLEALSRGAARAVFVERAAPALRCLRGNLAALDLADRAEVLARPVSTALARLAAGGRRFHWIFADPPYAAAVAVDTLAALGAGDLVGPDGVVVVEHDRRHPPPEANGVLALRDRRTYGDTTLSFYGRVSP